MAGRMRRVMTLLGTGLIPAGLLAQSPPPRLLPASVTNSDSADAIQPASVRQVRAPIEQFQDVRAFPPETGSALFAVRSAGEWLYQANQPSGQFRLSTAETDSARVQAEATLALAEAAAFVGDPTWSARAAGAVLTQLAVVRPDSGSPGFLRAAACVVEASLLIPGTDSTMLEAILLAELTQPQPNLHAVQALIRAEKSRPNPARAAALRQAIPRVAAGAGANPISPEQVLVLAEGVLGRLADGAITARLFQLSDELCQTSSSTSTEHAEIARALCLVVRVTRQVPDLERYERYRTAAVLRLHAAGSCQVPLTGPTSARGGCRNAPTEQEPSVEATAALTRASIAFLTCGAASRGAP